MNNPIGIAVIGYGYWSPKLIRNVRANEAYRLVAVCEKDTSRHALIRQENPGIDVFQDYAALFRRKDVQAVIVATIPSSHFRIAKQMLEYGKHVLVEKPMTLVPHEGELIMQIARRNGLTLMVDHTYLYAPAIRELARLVRSGALGTVYSVESTRVNLGLFQRDTNVLWDLAPHDFSIILRLFEERPSHISVVGSKTVVHPKQERAHESVAHVMLFYASFVAHIDVSWISPIKIRQITVIGSEQTVLYDQLAESQLTVFEQGVYPKQDGGESGPLFEYKTGDARTVQLPEAREDISTMLADFAACIREKKEPISSANIGLDVVRMLHAGEKSLRQKGKKVRIRYTKESKIFLWYWQYYTRIRHGY